MTKITAERLKELLEYDAATGIFNWRVNRGENSCSGKIAGGLDRGYLRIKVDGRRYKAHRLAWIYCTGAWPSREIDHINGDRADNRIDNLRDVSREENMQNIRRATKNSSTGLLGVVPRQKAFLAQITNGGKKIHIGTYKTPEHAHSAYIEAKRIMHSGCTL